MFVKGGDFEAFERVLEHAVFCLGQQAGLFDRGLMVDAGVIGRCEQR